MERLRQLIEQKFLLKFGRLVRARNGFYRQAYGQNWRHVMEAQDQRLLERLAGHLSINEKVFANLKTELEIRLASGWG